MAPFGSLGRWIVSWLLRSASPAAGRWRQRLSRQLFVAVGGVVDEGGNDDRVLAHVLFLDALVAVHVGVVRPRVVLHVVLDELESGQAHPIERLVIRASG